ncbi:putative phosphodiesterase I [Rosa chinensis]|uniref:Fanconi-associated nuclease n=1 Tax=Rosa chinensis TaxID=74649 RepID=A0A2P6QVG6_ROSCH|nr:fanconi-associated nuclease 1 homolog isoform X1 [Rosa chinensis]PRQ38139.1 putative phosphodiesterase I [Rosa chinensis]
MLKGRESLSRLVGKRRRFLPNRHSLLSAPTTTQSLLNLDIDPNGTLVSPEGSSNQDEQENTLAGSVACPVCSVKLSAQNNTINSHLDECLSRGTKRKLTQRTLLELNFCPVSKIQNFSCDSKQFGNDLFPAARDESRNQVDSPSRDPINKDEISEVPDFDVTITQDDIYGVILETFIVGRRFGDGTELYLGASIYLSRDPDNVKDPNAIKVVYSDSGCLKMLGFLPRKLAEYLSPLIDQYSLNFEGCVTSIPKRSIDVVPIQIVCHKTSDNKDFNDDKVFKCLWRNAQQVIESTKSCPPSAIKYQDNFCVFIREVLRNSSHLLTDDEKNFIESFTSMSDDSQRLFVRLYTRKGPWFRLSAISYPEVLDPQQAVKELSETGYASCFEIINKLSDDCIKEILDLLTVSELREILCILKQGCNRGLRKQDLIASLISSYDEDLCPLLPSMVLHRTGSCVRISSNAESLIWRAERLFFLNGEQDLSAFLLVDLGIVKYPTYKCIVSQQIFSARDDLLGYEEAIEVAQIVDEALDGSNTGLVLKCIKIADSHLSNPVQSLTSESMAPFLSHFSATFVNSKVVLLGISFLEREHRYNDAIYLLKRLLNCFARDGRRGYWTLRLSIDLEHMGYLNESLLVAENGLLDEWVRAGSRVALQRRVLRLGKPPRRWKTPSFAESVKRKIMEVNVPGRPLNCAIGTKSRFYGEDGEQCGVEQLALQYYAEEGGWQGVHTESGIWLTIFGLLMWDIIFSNVPNVFRTRFQTAPLDLETDSFYLVRKNHIESHLQKILDGMAEEILITSWELHEGTACRGVNWGRHSLSELRAAVTCIGGPCVAAFCRHLAQDYRSWSSGMPDLLLWRFHGKYRGEAKLVEVKGPRDRLSEQQRAWLLLLMDCGFNAEVCKVSPIV